jgi:hypothetical protein
VLIKDANWQVCWRITGHFTGRDCNHRSFFLDSTSDGEFLIVFRKPESLEISRRAVEASAHDIDGYHNRQKRMWESGTPLEALVELDRISEAGNQWPMDSLFC